MTVFRHSRLLTALQRHSEATPDKVALIEGDRRVTYAELWQKVLATAAFLQRLGVKQGDCIMLSARKEVEFVYLYFAAHLLGAVNVIVDIASKPDRLDYIAGLVKPQCIFGLSLKPEVYHCFRLSDVGVGEAFHGAVEASPDDVADIMFTTGTTGAPKGVCLSHANIAASADQINAFIGNTVDDVEVLGLPLSHSFGLGRLRCCLLKGATLVLIGNFANLKLFFDALERYHATGFGMVPAVWNYIKRLSGKRIANYAGQIKYIEIGSAAMPIADKELLLSLFPTTRICMHYGLTEASRAFFMEFHACKDNLSTIGRPASAAVEAKILDDAGHECKMGDDGEICVKGDMVMRSYFLPADNAHAFFGPYFRTGDWGHRDAAGYYYLAGRKKELINVGGKKISPAEIEDVIKSLGIADCACIAIPDPTGVLGEVPKAFLQKAGAKVTIDELKTQLAGRLEPYQMPVEYEWIDRIPRTASGKIQRLLLK